MTQSLLFLCGISRKCWETRRCCYCRNWLWVLPSTSDEKTEVPLFPLDCPLQIILGIVQISRNPK